MKLLTTTVLVVGLCFGIITESNACSRVTYTSEDGSVVTGRTMDWFKPDDVKLNLFPKGIEYSGLGSNPLKWTSKYASLAVTSYGFVNSGINEENLAVDVLYLEASNYGDLQPEEKTITSEMVTRFLLDNFSSAQEVADYFENEKFRVVLDEERAKLLGAPITIHYIVTDKTGDNVIIEYIDGKVKIHHQKGRIVFTNDPEYDKMLAIKDYFKEAGIEGGMPGSSLSQARFVYLTGWLDQMVNTPIPEITKEIPEYTFADQTSAMILSLMRGVSTPYGIVFDTEHLNNTSTLWRTVSDVKNGVFYFDSSLLPLTFKVDLNQVDFTKPKVVSPYKDHIPQGDITDLFK
ncbi:MAG: linear amide C-N hydrolase [Alphaproteobacteria bacterium]|nr:linear amide C-N hydrolase [Alphaproteobacteria bacterium]